MFMTGSTLGRRGGLGRLRADSDGTYDEQVIARNGNGRYTIRLRKLSGLRGLGGLGISPGNSVGPWTVIGPAVVTGNGSTAASAVASAGEGASAGLALGGPIGAGIGAIAGAIAGIWASHAARAKGATTENAVVASAVTAFDASLQAVFTAANSGQITGTQAAGLCTTILQSYWQGMAPYQVGPGRADASHGGTACGTLNPAGPCIGMINGPKCNSACTAGCCVGCQDLYPTILAAINLFNSASGGTMTACEVYGSGYGYSGRPSYTLTYTPPAPTTVAGASNAVSNVAAVATDLSSTVAGIPLWVLLAGGGLALFVATR
jgi:hypothetical protein